MTIPQDVRNRRGLLPHTEVEFELAGDHARIRKSRRTSGAGVRGNRALEALRGTTDTRMSTDEIMALDARRGSPWQERQVTTALTGLQTRLRNCRGVLVDSNILLDIATNDAK